MSRFVAVLLLSGALAASALADGPQDNLPANVRRIPKLGIELNEADRKRLTDELAALDAALEPLGQSKDVRVAELLPDIQIYRRAVHDALEYQELFAPADVKSALELLAEGRQRAEQLARGEAPWTQATGLVVRGYVSKIDGSVQPYGLVIPADWRPGGGERWRLDLWFHGRGETLSEVNFIAQRRKQVGTFAPADAIVLHPYGRYSNANKFAGEIDAYEALDDVRRRYRIDDDRVSVRGFSMGGASTWHMAVHNPGRWAAANPGAGFAETPEFLRAFQKEDLKPAWYEEKLWRLYDCDRWAVNLYNCPTVAYSGELDRQKQAADLMQRALAAEGIELAHVIGPGVEHKYEPDAQAEVARRIDGIVAAGRRRLPPTIHFVTYTLRYNRMAWLVVDSLGEHWEEARVDAALGRQRIDLATNNVTGLTLEFASGEAPFDVLAPVMVHVNGQTIAGPRPTSDRAWSLALHQRGGQWHAGTATSDGLRKSSGLQGPIDDAFMDGFMFVRPSRPCASELVEKWTRAELDRAIEHWRRHFRGEVRVKLDQDVTDDDIASLNLVVWGDPQANSILARIADKLPIRQQGNQWLAGDRRWPAATHAPVLIYPNPLNPRRYVVLNSSFTFREYAYLNNARQVPMLPDWAIVDLRTPPDAIRPGRIDEAEFFDEFWQLRPPRP